MKSATAALSQAVNRCDVTRVWRALQDTTQRWQILTALTRLADYLADHPAPIDYRRRRALDYANLLPEKQWALICRSTGAFPGVGRRLHLARAHLFQRLTQSPYYFAPVSANTSTKELRSELALFPTLLFPGLADALNAAGQEFLAHHGINDEPCTWQPPLSLIDDLALPGTPLDELDIAALHKNVHQGLTPIKAGQALHISADAVRFLLEENPAPARLVRSGHGPLPGPRIVAPSLIPQPELEHLYLRERLSIREIAARARISRSAVTDLLRHYDIPIGRRPPANVTPDWLRREYIENGRSFEELVPEAGIGPNALARWARKFGLTVRSRGGRSRSNKIV